MAASPFQDTAFRVLMQNWLPEKPLAVIDWTLSVEDDQTRRLVLGMVAENLGTQQNVTEIAAWIQSF